MSLRRDSAMLRGHTLVTGAHDGSKAGQNPAKPVYFLPATFVNAASVSAAYCALSGLTDPLQCCGNQGDNTTGGA